MATKSSNQQGRRTPLSLTASGGPKQQQQQQQQVHQINKSSPSPVPTGHANEKKNESTTVADFKESLKDTKRQQKSQLPPVNEEKTREIQNGVEKAQNSSNRNDKPVQQNGNQDAPKEKAEKPPKDGKSVVAETEKPPVEKRAERETRAKRSEAESAEKKKIETATSETKSTPPATPPKSAAASEKKSVTPTSKPFEKVSPATVEKKVATSPKAATPTKPKPSPKASTSVAANDMEVESASVNTSPTKIYQSSNVGPTQPTATSTPGKLSSFFRHSFAPKSELVMQTSTSPPRSYSQISGRRSIRPVNDFTSSQYRGSYRRICNDLDDTNTSLNVTVGSEVPNNSSFSFFSRGRKRERTPPKSRSALDLQDEVGVLSPPKRSRLDVYGIFSVVASPLTLLRSRFSKTSIQTPLKTDEKMAYEDKNENHNVSGVSIEEEMPQGDAVETATNDGESVVASQNNLPAKQEIEVDHKSGEQGSGENEDIKFKEIALAGDAAKNSRCIVM